MDSAPLMDSSETQPSSVRATHHYRRKQNKKIEQHDSRHEQLAGNAHTSECGLQREGFVSNVLQAPDLSHAVQRPSSQHVTEAPQTTVNVEDEGDAQYGHHNFTETVRDETNPPCGKRKRDQTAELSDVVEGRTSEANVGPDHLDEDKTISGELLASDELPISELESTSSPNIATLKSLGCSTAKVNEDAGGDLQRSTYHHAGDEIRGFFDCRTIAMFQLAERAGEGQTQTTMALWVKWRGKWEPGIRCIAADCPLTTLKTRPNYSKKNHVVVYFPQVRTFQWVDSQQTLPISHDPWPLLYGTHGSCRELVKDENLPRRRMLLKLGGEMLDISDRLHITAVVQRAQNVNVWKTFAKEAAAATKYSELGTLLVRLHLAIAPLYVRPTWIEKRHGQWKEDCAKAPTASVVQKLTKELISAVMWEEVAPLWNAPEQPELEPEWEHWKGDAFRDSDDDRDTSSGMQTAPDNLTANAPNNAPKNGTSQGMQNCATSCSKRFKEQARARRQTQLSSDMLESSQQKRLKVDKIPSASPGGPASSSHGHAVTAFRSPLVHPAPSLAGQQIPSTQGPPSHHCREVVPGCTLASVVGQPHMDKEPSSNPSTPEAHQTELYNNEGIKSCQMNEVESSLSVLDVSLASNSGLCSAYLKLKNRRCHRPVKEGITYCGKHKQLANPENLGKDLAKEGALAWESGLCSAVLKNEHKRCVLPTSNGSIFCTVHAHIVIDKHGQKSAGSAYVPKEEHIDFESTALVTFSNEDRCRGITTRGVQCTHKPKDGHSFCVKHSTKVTTIQEPGEVQTLLGNLEVPSCKIGRVSKVDSQTGNRTGDFQIQAGQAINECPTSRAPGNGVVLKNIRVSSEVKTAVNDGVSRKRKWLSALFDKDSVQTAKALASRKQETHHSKLVESKAKVGRRCIGRTTRNDDQCSFRARAGSMYCTKHLKAIRARKRIEDQTVPISDSKPGSSTSGAQELFERFLKTAEGISSEAYGSDFHKQLLKWTRAEAAKDHSTAVELLKLVTGEMSRLQKILQPRTGYGPRKAEKTGLPALVNGTLSSSHVPEKQYQNDGSLTVRCGLCDVNFAAEAELGKHWKDTHRKEVSLFVRCHACQACGRLYSRKHTVQRHWKKRHQSIPVASPECAVVCSLCEAQFNHTNDLLGHIISGHPDQLSNPKLKEFIALGCVVNTAKLETKLTLQCGDCHKKFSTHWDLFHHKEKIHKTKETEDNTQVLTEERKVEGQDSASPSVPQSLGCRICGKKFSLLSDLGRHQQAEHSSKIPGAALVGLSGKRAVNSEGCRMKLPIRRKDEEKVAGLEQSVGVSIRRKRNRRFPKHFQKDINEKDSDIGKEVLLYRMKAALQTAQLRNLRQLQNSEVSVTPTRKGLYTLTKGGRMVPYGDCESTQEDLPDDSILLEMAKSVCCESKFRETLNLKNKQLPEQLLARVSQLCSEANVELEWEAEGHLCTTGCKETDTVEDTVSPKPDGTKISAKTVELGKCSLNLQNVDSKSKAVIVCDDLSGGQEPVPVICSVDQDVFDTCRRMQNKDGSSSSETFKSWDSFSYITKRVLDPSLGLDPENYKVGCSCSAGQCSPQTCDHVDIFDNDNVEACDIFGKPMKSRFPYDDQGCIILEEGYLVYECNSSCNCQQNCQNRVLQKGVTVKLDVFRTLDKGWAVRAAQMIPRGTFVCEYVGEVLRDEEANKRGERYDQVGCSYLYDIDAHLDTTGKASRSKPFVIDATKHGNVARFINHSCEPNLVNYQVLVDSMDCQLAHIGLFASRDIQSGEELAYDYRYRLLPGKGCPCHCGAANCRKRLY